MLVGRAREGVLFRAASDAAAVPQLLVDIDTLFGLDHYSTLAYDDARRGIGRRVRVQDGRIEAVRLAGDVAAEPWLRELFDRQEAVANLGSMLLSPALKAGAPRDRVVCSCWNVSEREIRAFLEGAAPGPGALATLQQALKCGTECGSCVPELKQLVASTKAAA